MGQTGDNTLDLCLIASGWLDPGMWIAVAKVVVGLGMVIFVHELGHFVVAKLCGVKCEKFYLGFDIGGWRFCRLTLGETEYGIGILPLGGYVKMLGQEDNPAKLQEEIDRAKQDDTTTCSGDARTARSEKIDPNEAAAALYDPRSFLAKSVPKRMAIISAGVVMNLIFAFLMAMVAYKMGVKQIVCGVGGIVPGKAAWMVNMKVGDRIIEIGGRKVQRFRDLREAVSLGDIDNGIPIVVSRPGAQQPLKFNVMPDSSGLLPIIGVVNPWTTSLLPEEIAVRPGSAAAKARPKFELGDRIVRIDDVPIDDYAQLHSCLTLHSDETLKVTVERKDQAVTIDVPPNPMRRLGLVMELGEISAVQEGSPAVAAGIRPGEKIVKIDGRPPGDPMTLGDRLGRRAGETITLTVERESNTEPTVDLPITLRRADWYETPMTDGDPMTAPSLGIAYRVLGRVRSVIDGSPAAAAGLRAGDRIVRATVIPPDKDAIPPDLPFVQKKTTVRFGREHRNWPSFIYALQDTLPGTSVELQWVRREQRRTAVLTPAEAQGWFNPDRGFFFEPFCFYQTAETWGEAAELGAEETINATLLVYRFLHKLGRQVSIKALGGPIAIFTVAKRAADEGTAKLLIFLTLLSANLAVINFLPIPLLDGGLMVFLIWEGIRGKPADERVQVVLTYLGLIFILSLMVWVIGLDVVRLVSGF